MTILHKLVLGIEITEEEIHDELEGLCYEERKYGCEYGFGENNSCPVTFINNGPVGDPCACQDDGQEMADFIRNNYKENQNDKH